MHIYVIERPDGLVKVGRAINPTKRIRNLETQGGFLSSRAWISIPGAFEARDELRAHHALHLHRTVGEWFLVDFDKAVLAVVADNEPPFCDRISPTAVKNPDITVRALETVIKIVGTQDKLAKAMGLQPMAISQWRKRQVPAERCRAVAELSQGAVSVNELRPDVFGPPPASITA